jgi:hypothetical protein
MITSGGNRKPANADRGGRTQHGRRGISSVCLAHHPSKQQTQDGCFGAAPQLSPSVMYICYAHLHEHFITNCSCEEEA